MYQLASAVTLAIFPVLVIAGALKDVTSFTIPNWLNIALALAFAPAALVAHFTLGQVGLHLGVGLAFLFAGMVMFALGWIGGGDAKLFAAAALWLGWPAAVAFLLYTTLAGGGLAVVLLGARKSQLGVLALQGPGWLNRLLEKDGPAPYGVAIAVGALAAFPHSPFLDALKTLPFGI